ncbi:gas vesicle protein GvpG [Streptomyces litchfieldiae]|uniref:Gas vesicle protein GvpG n=1 Tax=Streptomyces litchfieldiae TaxID=3075543 RepID=A0ABU2MUT5_9ACTN|nr:gas vesicle protein GvpG [Streptomyces sp. DSM 44938]MDT0345411.1 gas vesicle protein GvpG [Streptomyces sp. DSM 44938]
MGLLRELFLLPLAPVRGAGWVLSQVAAEADRRFSDPAVVQRELALLEEELLCGLIDETEFARREDELLDRLDPTDDWLTR